MTSEFRDVQRPWHVSSDLAVSESLDSVTVLTLTVPGASPVVFTGTALAIWGAIDGTRNTQDIVSHLSTSYQLPPEAISAETTEFLLRLAAQHFIHSRAQDG